MPRLVGIVLLAAAAAVPLWAADEVEPWVYAHAGLAHFYNVEYNEAIADFQDAIQADPANLHFQNYLANAYLFQELHRLGQLEGNLYNASNSFLKEKKPQPDPARIAKFKEIVERVKKECNARLAKNPRDADALYVLGAVHGMEANYHFTVERKWMDALRDGGKANDLHEKALKIDPNYHDAKLIPGLYQYVVGSIPRGVKWLAFLFGYRGSRKKGIEMLQQTMVNGKLVSSDAAFLLAVVYSREKRYDYARRLLTSLSEFYPRNPLVRLEVGRTYAREGNVQAALERYVEVAKAVEAGKFDRRKLTLDRLWYQIGTLYQQTGQPETALVAYGRVTESSDSDGLVKAYSGLRRGEILLALNRPEQAREEFKRVAAMPYQDPSREAQSRLAQMGN